MLFVATLVVVDIVVLLVFTSIDSTRIELETRILERDVRIH